DLVGARLLDQRLPRALGRQPDEFQLIALAADVERLPANASCRAQDQQALAARHTQATCKRPHGRAISRALEPNHFDGARLYRVDSAQDWRETGANLKLRRLQIGVE